MLVDITEHKQADKQLSQLNAELERRVAERTRDLVYSQNRLRKSASDLSLTEERERRGTRGNCTINPRHTLLVATELSRVRGGSQPGHEIILRLCLNDVDRRWTRVSPITL